MGIVKNKQKVRMKILLRILVFVCEIPPKQKKKTFFLRERAQEKEGKNRLEKFVDPDRIFGRGNKIEKKGKMSILEVYLYFVF